MTTEKRWDDLTPEEKVQAIDPDGVLGEAEIRDRLEYFEAQHNKVAFGDDERRKKVASFGYDTEGQYRALLPGEELDDKGVILTVDPARAEEAARRFKEAEPRDVRQRMRRSEMIQSLVHVVMNRAGNDAPNVVHLSLDKCTELHREYQQARAEGYSDADLDFLPLSAYAHKIWPDNKPAIRPMLEHEFGVFQMASNPSSPLAGRIVCVADRDLPK